MANSIPRNKKTELPTLVFLRHASRDPIGTDQLSAEGHKQAHALSKDLVAHLDSEYELRPTKLFASPKTRCQQTMRFFATALELKVEVTPAIDERAPNEGAEAFASRVRTFADERTPADGAHSGDALCEIQCEIYCSHLDWLEEVALYLPSDETDLERGRAWLAGSYRIFQFIDGIWRRK